MPLQFTIGSNHQKVLCMQQLKKFHGRRVSDLTMRDVAEIRARATSPSTLLVTSDGLVESFHASDSLVDGQAGVLTVGRVAWILTHRTDNLLTWCALQLWPLHPGKATFEDHRAEIEALPIVGKHISLVLLADISLAQEFAAVTHKNAIEIVIVEGAIYVAYACTVDGMLHAIEVSSPNRTVTFGAEVEPVKALASLVELHRALGAAR